MLEEKVDVGAVAGGTLVPFFVYLIESPSERDFAEGRREGEWLREAVEMNGVPCVLRGAITGKSFREALFAGLRAAIRSMGYPLPVIHISAHGNREGVELANGELVRWDTLGGFLAQINAALDGNLIVCLSSCDGFSGGRMVMASDKPFAPLPFCALVACRGSPTYTESGVGFATFYHWLSTGATVEEAVAAMRHASRQEGYGVQLGEDCRRSYLEIVAKLWESGVVGRLREMVEGGRGMSAGACEDY